MTEGPYLHSNDLQAVLAARVLPVEQIVHWRARAVVPGELVRGAHELVPALGDLQITAGEGVACAPGGEYRATRYGYVCLHLGLLSVVSPLWLDPEAMEVHWLVLDPRPHPVTVQMVQECLAELGVVEGIDGNAIEGLVAQVRLGSQRCGAFRIASGTRPLCGQDGRMALLVQAQRPAGKEREDGSMDFREENYSASVQAGQVVARYTPPTTGTPGRNLRGQVLAAEPGRDCCLQVGDQVRTEQQDGVVQYFAQIAGSLKVERDTVSVVRRLHIAGNVDFRTGNLDFVGEICVEGSVVRGFSVKAQNDISITGTVEAGATVAAGRDLVVGGGIVGHKTRANAGGTVQAQFVQEATVVAGEDILLGSFAYQARLRAGGWVRVARGGNGRGGSVIGGQVWAHGGIDVHLAGSAGQAVTSLMAGVDADTLRQLDRLKEVADFTHNKLRQVLEQLGLNRVDVQQIKNLIAAATGTRRKLLAAKARNLGQLVQTYQRVAAARLQLEQRVAGQLQGTEILVHDQAFPGVEIRLGEHRRVLEREVQTARFRIVAGQLVER